MNQAAKLGFAALAIGLWLYALGYLGWNLTRRAERPAGAPEATLCAAYHRWTAATAETVDDMETLCGRRD